MRQTTLEEIDAIIKSFEMDDAIPFSWDYGVVTRITEDEREKYASKKCAICDSDENVDYERLSGGTFSLICKRCAIEYVKSAKRRMLEEKRKRC